MLNSSRRTLSSVGGSRRPCSSARKNRVSSALAPYDVTRPMLWVFSLRQKPHVIETHKRIPSLRAARGHDCTREPVSRSSLRARPEQVPPHIAGPTNRSGYPSRHPQMPLQVVVALGHSMSTGHRIAQWPVLNVLMARYSSVHRDWERRAPTQRSVDRSGSIRLRAACCDRDRSPSLNSRSRRMMLLRDEVAANRDRDQSALARFR